MIEFAETSNGKNLHTKISGLNHLLKQKPESFITYLPSRNGHPQKVKLSASRPGQRIPGNTLYYHGYAVAEEHSLIALKIYGKQMSALISDPNGNYRCYSSGTEIKLRPEDISKSATSWSCQSEDLYDMTNVKSGSTAYKSLTGDTIKVYFVCDYALFESFGFSTTATTQYIYDLFHQVQAIYSQESISIEIEDIFIWEQPDPYDHTSAQNALTSFKNHLGNSFPGNVAHLLSGDANPNGGVALINGICNRSNAFAYSNVDGATGLPGNYSWDVHVVAHEIGHNLGSRHTHECVWGPNGDEAIDACGGPPPGCQNAPIPAQGGTIMSYCHQWGVGVNFSLGFGTEPGDLIRDVINICLPDPGESCDQSISITTNGTFSTGAITTGAGASQTGATHARWYQFIAPEDGTIDVASCNQGVDTRLFIHTGQCHNSTLLAQSDDDCLSGSGYFYASEIRDLQVQRDQMIWLEWDDKWSPDGFDFNFTFTPVPTPLSNCNDQNPLPGLIDSTTQYSSMQAISYSGRIDINGSLLATSDQSFEFMNSFEILTGGQMDISIKECRE